MKQLQVIICIILILFCCGVIGDSVPSKSDLAPYLPFDPLSKKRAEKVPQKSFCALLSAVSVIDG